MEPVALKGILLSCLLKLLSKLVERRFTVQDPAKFHIANATTGKEFCVFDNGLQPQDSAMSTATTWLFTVRYLLPVLGGLLSSARLGYIRVLQLGGYAMLLAAALLSLSGQLGLMCTASPVIPLNWLLLLLFFALIQANVQYGIFRWHKRGRGCTVVATLYVVTAAVGEFSGIALARVNELGNHLTLLFVIPCLLFIALSFQLPPESGEPFDRPTQRRTTMYCRIFSGQILFLISVDDTRSKMYTAEMKTLLNGTEYLDSVVWLSPDWTKYFSLMVLLPVFILATALSPREVSPQARMQAGILLEACVAAALAAFTLAGPRDRAVVAATYVAASALDGVAEGLVMVAAYDLGNRLAPPSSKALVLGIMFTVWGLANVASRCLLLILSESFSLGEGPPRFYLYHLASLAALIACLVYHRFVAFKLAVQLIPVHDDAGDASESDGAGQPLLPQMAREI